ncbi:MAG: hypothetical protein H6Q81_585 [Deltaproteobacteria bacterium]|nr:hypothetical protein [Deltaproteobacteria bacterium]
MSRRQERIIRRMMILSVVVHAGVFLLGSTWSALFPSREFSPPVLVELMDAPVSELPEEPPVPPPPVAASSRPESFRASSDRSASTPLASKQIPAARRWLDKLDAGMAKAPEAPVARGEGKAGGIPVRRWTNDGPVRPGDFAPAVAPEHAGVFRKHLEDLEGRVRTSGRPAVGFGEETEASMMFGGAGDAPGEPIPAWIREMIRKRVRARDDPETGARSPGRTGGGVRRCDPAERGPEGENAGALADQSFREDRGGGVGRGVVPRRRVRERCPCEGPAVDLRAAGGTNRGGTLPLRFRRTFVKGQKTPGVRRKRTRLQYSRYAASSERIRSSDRILEIWKK